MSIDLAQTPTLQAVATGDERVLEKDLQQRVDAAAQQAASRPEVIAAEESEQEAAEKLARLMRAERALNGHARQIAVRSAEVREAALDTLIESAALSEKPDYKPLTELLVLEHRGRYLSRALERLVETRLPLARIARLREESHAAMVRAKALEQVACERAEKLLDHLRDAVSEEVVLPVDMSKGVAGSLVAQAAEYRRRAVAISENADQLEKTYGPRR
ncbi:MAG TPA: hypothetical protein VGR73_06550 [Bryobacteraceae bacterium]|nr:hypothetical protein [Bryobacteraceae bacterium]